MRRNGKKRAVAFLTAVLMLYARPCAAGQISDYTYEDGDCRLITANRDAGKQIALTFDDGPCPRYTEEILSILAENGAKATFFIIGENAKAHPELVKAAYDAGHEIGNHTYTHPDIRKVSAEAFGEEIRETQEILHEITGAYPVLFRPPGGYLSNAFVEKITENGCKPVLWSWRQDTRDWAKPSVDTIVKNVLSNLCDGDIILFHDFGTKGSPTSDALRRLLPKLREMGYECVTVSELAGLK